VNTGRLAAWNSKTAGSNFDDICEWMGLIAGMDIQTKIEGVDLTRPLSIDPYLDPSAHERSMNQLERSDALKPQ
jgi:hypothetical protein